MSHKLGVMLSLIIFLNCFFMIFDLYNAQLINTTLVTGSNYVNSLILSKGKVDGEVFDFVENKMKGKLYVLDDSYPAPCEQLTYTIVIEYKSIYLNDIQKMSITRSVLFGYTLS